MSEWLHVAVLVPAILSGVIMAFGSILLVDFRKHATAWMREQEEINKLLRQRIERLERPLAWAAVATDDSQSLYLSVSRQAAERLCRTEGWTLVPLYAAQQDRVVRLPTFRRSEDSRYEGGWNLAMSAVYAALYRAGVKWELSDE